MQNADVCIRGLLQWIPLRCLATTAKDSTWKAYYPSDRDGTNAYGFSALPAGRMYKSSLAGGGSYTLWWAAEDDGPYSANVWYIEGSKMYVEAKPKYETAYYVRCVED